MPPFIPSPRRPSSTPPSFFFVRHDPVSAPFHRCLGDNRLCLAWAGEPALLACIMTCGSCIIHVVHTSYGGIRRMFRGRQRRFACSPVGLVSFVLARMARWGAGCLEEVSRLLVLVSTLVPHISLGPACILWHPRPTDVSMLHFGKHAATYQPMGIPGMQEKVQALVCLPAKLQQASHLPPFLFSFFFFFSCAFRPCRRRPKLYGKLLDQEAVPRNRLGKNSASQEDLWQRPIYFVRIIWSSQQPCSPFSTDKVTPPSVAFSDLRLPPAPLPPFQTASGWKVARPRPLLYLPFPQTAPFPSSPNSQLPIAPETSTSLTRNYDFIANRLPSASSSENSFNLSIRGVHVSAAHGYCPLVDFDPGAPLLPSSELLSSCTACYISCPTTRGASRCPCPAWAYMFPSPTPSARPPHPRCRVAHRRPHQPHHPQPPHLCLRLGPSRPRRIRRNVSRDRMAMPRLIRRHPHHLRPRPVSTCPIPKAYRRSISRASTTTSSRLS